jgi:hypothetical protein
MKITLAFLNFLAKLLVGAYDFSVQHRIPYPSTPIQKLFHNGTRIYR